MTGRRINQAGLRLIMQSEGCRLKSYKDVAGVWTCGFGAVGEGVGPDTVWSQEQCNERLVEDVRRFEKAVDELVKTDISQNQFSSLVSFAFNVGAEAFRRSTLLRLLNAGDTVGAGRQLLLWVRAGGKIQPGLVTRRRNELALYQRPDRG